MRTAIPRYDEKQLSNIHLACQNLAIQTRARNLALPKMKRNQQLVNRTLEQIFVA